MENWIVDHRRKICGECPKRAGCAALVDVHLWWQDAPKCPLGKLPDRNAAVAARAWPAGVEPLSGCCDRADQA